MTAARYIARAVELADAASPGRWRADDEHGDIEGGIPAWTVSREADDGEFLGDIAYTASPTREQADAEFIAFARDFVPKAAAALAAVLSVPEVPLHDALDDTDAAYKDGLNDARARTRAAIESALGGAE